MIKILNRIVLIVLIGLLIPVSETAATADSDIILTDKAALLKKIDRKLHPESYTSYKKIINIDSDGKKKEFVMFVAKKDVDKVLGTFLAPKTEVGRSTLRIGENMWLYIPTLKKPIRITSIQSITGGLFNNADIMGIDYSTEYDCVKATVEQNEILLELKAKTKSVAYEKLLLRAAKDTLLPQEIACYTASGMLIKTLHFKKVKDFGNGLVRPAVIETDSPLHKGARSILIFSRLRSQKLADELFTINSMSKFKDLR